ncbi:hypothetical protein BGW80DRAFT_756075 [Lactifluus volemus]|nr:hypothetical protein BGW80DRAFT_756075 [Lactifluus volemus]
MTQRDELFWTGTADLPTSIDGVERRTIDFRAHEPDIDNLRERIESVVPYFCAVPTCVQALCPQHVQEFPAVPPAIPRVASNDYPNGESCGAMCFREMDETFQEDSILWGDPDVDELLCILEIIPDTLPCGLAKLVRKPCREVWIQRRRLIPDDRIYPESVRTRTAAGQFEKPGSIEKYVPPDPCVHLGPCDQNNPECTCAENLAYCSRRCLCSVTCGSRILKNLFPLTLHLGRRRQGCSCKSKGKKQTCAGNNCSCRKRGWECDPTVCKCDLYDSRKGKARIKQVSKQRRQLRPDDKYVCQNSDIQRGRAAELEIKSSAYGLGAFAIRKILKGQLIGEYVGELMPESDSGKRGILRKHVDLNYNFELNPNIHIDSARVGNETRYLNHGEEDSANAHATTKLVFGEQRIGIFALRNIRAGEEVRFDYGQTYWFHEE